MTLQQKFTEKYGISPLKLVEDTNYEYLGFIKKNNLTRALERYIEEKKLNIEVNSEFEKDLVEAFAEAGERFPEGGKIGSLEKGVLLSIPNVNASVPKSKGTLENFKEIVGKDELRPVMSGVFVSEDGASLVGTDAHKLVVQKTNEYSEYAGKIIDLKVFTQTKGKKIPFIDGKYPNYNAVIPKDNPNEVKNFDTYALYNAAKSSIAVHKLVEQTLFNLNLNLPTVNGDGTMIASFNPVIVADVTTFALVNGWNKFTLEYSTETRAYILNFGEGNIGLIMPIMNRYGDLAGLHGGEVMTPEEIMDKYKFAGKMKSVKPAATKPARPSAPVSLEPFKEFKGEYDEEDTTYVLRRDIESITLTNGEVLGKNDVVQGFYRVKKKMATGGGIYSSDEMYVLKVYDLKGNLLDDSTRFRERNERRAKEHAIYYYEDDMRDKYGSDLMFTVELAKPKMAHGGSMYADGGNLGKTGTKTYKLRAEGLNDFLAFLQNDMYFKMKYFTIEPTGFPDVVVTFETSSSLSEIKEKLREVPDSHVMLQTVKPINEYTGDREEEGKYAYGGSMYAGGGYVRPSYDTRVSGKYDFKTNTGLGYELLVVGYERKNDDSDSLYFDDLESTAKKELGSIIIKNNSWKNLSKGQPIVAISETGIKGRLTRIGNLYAHGGSMYAGGGKIDPIDMAEVESSAIFYTEKGKWSPEPTVEKFENQIKEYQEMKRALDNKEIRPSKVIGTGIKPQYVRPLAYRWIEERTLIAKRAIEILKERMGGAKSSSHEVGDTVTFNSVMGGTKTGTIISKMGEEGFRIQVGNGFATVKKSAIV
jgi:hypothetical protein